MTRKGLESAGVPCYAGRVRPSNPLLALFLAVLTAGSVMAADEAPDALAAAVRDAGQLKVLRVHELKAPPNLLNYGLTLDADGVYRAAAPPPNSPPGTPRRTATPGQLAAVLARWTLTPSAATLAARSPAPPPGAAEAALAAHREVGRATDRRLNDAAGSLATPDGFDSRWGALNAAGARPSGNSEPLRRGLLRLGAERLADGALLPRPGQPPEAANASAWAGLSAGEIGDKMFDLRNGGTDAEIAARKNELIRVVLSGDGESRGRALELLGRLHDESLLPILLPALRREKGYQNRRRAADALGAIVAGYKAKSGGWSEFLDKAPPILNVMMKTSPNWNFGTEMLRPLYMGLDLINLMEPADEKRFLAGFDDPRVLLMMLSLGDTSRIEHDAGVHSDSAALIYARYRELVAAGAPGLGAFLSDDAVAGETRATLLDRLNRYRFVGPELETDETFRRELPKILFGKGSHVYPNTVFSISVLAAGMPKAEFVRHSMDFIRSASAADARSAVAFFLLHPQMLTAAQRAELEKRGDGLDDALRASLAAHRARPPVYDGWPKSGVNAALVFTQAGHADNFFRALTKLGYRLERGPKGQSTYVHRDARGEIRLTALVTPSDKEGWALDRVGVGRAIVERMADPKYQVVIYRGHVGDYGSPVGDETFAGKVFVDLSCDSDTQSDKILGACKNCAFFGTNSTAEGSVNNAFLPQVLSALAARESFAQMSARFERSMPRLFHRFTGTWSPALLWAAATDR